MEKFNDRFNQVIQETNLTQAEISRLLGIHPPTLSKYIHGNSGMSIETLYNFCKTFDVDANWLLGLDSKPKSAISAKDLAVLRTRGKHVESAALKVGKAKPGAGLRKRKYEIKD